MEINIKTTSKEIADLVSELQSRPLKLKEALKIDAETIAKAVQTTTYDNEQEFVSSS